MTDQQPPPPTSLQPQPPRPKIKYNPDIVLRTMLASVTERKAGDPDQSALLRQRNMEIKTKLNSLVALRAQNWPNVPPNLDTAIAELYFKRYYYFVWRIFPINELPEEILLKIFHYVAWSSHEVHVAAVYRLQLTWVCKHWRYAAINDMFLWNSIWFRDPPPYNRSLAFLDRAGTAPLDLRINERNEQWYKDHMGDDDGSSEDGHPFTAAMMSALMDRILEKIQILRTLIIVLDTWPPALVVLAKLRDAGITPGRLERFELHRTGRPWLWIGPRFEPEEHRDPIPFCDGRVVPKLNYLCLNGIHTDWNASHISNLTVLDLRRLAMECNPTLYQYRDMLRASPNLSKLALDAAGPRWLQKDVANTGLEPIDLPNLTIFVLGDVTVLYALYCLEMFTAPNVIDLTILNMTGTDYGDLIEDLTSRFLEVQVLTVYTVEVEDSVNNKRRLIRWLKSMPKLSFLKVAQLKRHVLRAFLEDPRQWDGSAVDIFAPKSGLVPLCPKLEILEYQSLDLELVTMFLEGRKLMDAPMKKLYIISAWFLAMTVEDKNKLSAMAPVYQFVPGMPSPEEMVVRKEWCITKGLPLGYWY